MCLAEDIGALIYYTDTDSMHIEDRFVCGKNDSLLGQAFRGKYGRELIGKQLGQFHTDFEFGGSFSIVDSSVARAQFRAPGLAPGAAPAVAQCGPDGWTHVLDVVNK